MPRAPTTLDSFAAIAEPRRRQVLELLALGGKPVNDLVVELGWPQPQVSKHLGVLREVGLVNVRKVGRQRVYTLNGDKLKPVHEWVKHFERFWKHQLDRVKERAEAKAKQVESNTDQPKQQER